MKPPRLDWAAWVLVVVLLVSLGFVVGAAPPVMPAIDTWPEAYRTVDGEVVVLMPEDLDRPEK